MKAGARLGILSPDIFAPAQAGVIPLKSGDNRTLRRAKASLRRKALRCVRKHGSLNPDDYMPRAYAHIAFVKRMNKSITPAQFKEYFLRDNNISRVQVYGMDSAHEITKVIKDNAANIFAQASCLMTLFALSPAAPADPAPP